MLHPFANLIIMQCTTQLLWASSDSTQPHVEKANELRNVLHIYSHTGVSWFLYATKVLNRLQWKMSMVHGFERLFTLKDELGAWLIELARHPSDGCCCLHASSPHFMLLQNQIGKVRQEQ
jgi:hypothetical protein